MQHGGRSSAPRAEGLTPLGVLLAYFLSSNSQNCGSKRHLYADCLCKKMFHHSKYERTVSERTSGALLPIQETSTLPTRCQIVIDLNELSDHDLFEYSQDTTNGTRKCSSYWIWAIRDNSMSSENAFARAHSLDHLYILGHLFGSIIYARIHCANVVDGAAIHNHNTRARVDLRQTQHRSALAGHIPHHLLARFLGNSPVI
ncbi:hypothetical protein J6590_077385 [Homalodisca vitripennis]|nr:hypothetical protein J6590_077385 [Homalodisca vitripennis]